MLQIEAREEAVGVHFGEIVELEQPITRILKQIIRDGKRYDLVIGDDTSGRIPALIIGKVLNASAQEQDQEAIPIRFADIVYADSGGEMKRIFKKLDKKPKRILLVTEFIAKGSKLQSFGKFFSSHNIPYDVATIDMLEKESFYRESGRLPKSAILYFDRDQIIHHTPRIYGQRFITGLRRNVCLEDRVIRDSRSVRYYVACARKDVSLLSEKIIDRLRGDK